MVRPPHEVQEAIRNKLEELTSPGYLGYPLTGGNDDNERSAFWYLRSKGYITDVDDSLCTLTPEGWDYYDRLKSGAVRYWLRNNWFPFVVAVTTALVGMATIVTNLLN